MDLDRLEQTFRQLSRGDAEITLAALSAGTHPGDRLPKEFAEAAETLGSKAAKDDPDGPLGKPWF